MADVVIARVRMLFEQLMRHQHEAGRAEAALERAAIDESLLHIGQRAAGIEMLDGRDALAVNPDREIEAAGHGDIVDQHGAAAAQSLAAAFARAEQIETRPHHSSNHSSSSGRPSCARKARSTASAVIGSSTMRTPTASWIAFAIAGDTPKE